MFDKHFVLLFVCNFIRFILQLNFNVKPLNTIVCYKKLV